MRPPFRSVFPVEPLSKWKTVAVVALGSAIASAVAFALAADRTLAYFQSVIRYINWPLSPDEGWFLLLAVQRLSVVLLAMAFGNVVVAYLSLKLMNSIELRLLLRVSLHLTIWIFLFNLICIVLTFIVQL